jgi:hypothetical protein
VAPPPSTPSFAPAQQRDIHKPNVTKLTQLD